MDTAPAPQPLPQRLDVRYFDGRSSRPHAAQAWFDGTHLLLGTPECERRVDAQQVQWPERTRHGPRIALLPGGGSFQSNDAAAWDAWVQGAGHRDGVVVRLQQSWRGVLASLAVLLVLTGAAYLWGLPWLARSVADHLPDSVENRVGDAVAAQLQAYAKPSQLPAQDQRAIEQTWQQMLGAHTAAQAARGVAVRPSRLLIRSSTAIGPNALALPGGTMLLTDDMVRLLRNDPKVIAGVLAHEQGHVQHRHGMRMLVQLGVLGAVTSLLWGDYSGVLATVPLWLGQAHYSRDAEREADTYSVAMLRDAGVSPAIMVDLFDRIELFQRCGRAVLAPGPVEKGAAPCQPSSPPDGHAEDRVFSGLGFASHPAGEERKAFFLAATQ